MTVKFFFLTGIGMAVILGGCAGPVIQTSYRNVLHPSDNQMQFSADWYSCERQNTHRLLVRNAQGAESSGSQINENMAWQCMGANGWEKVTQRYYR